MKEKGFDNDGRTKRLLTDTVLFGLSSFGSKILVFFLTPLYTSILSTEAFGIADLINTTINFIYPILTLAISEATLRYTMMKNSSKKSILNNSLLLVTISVIALICIKPLIAKIDPSLSEYWKVFVITFALYNLHLCISNFIKGLGRTKLFAIQGIVHTAVLVSANIIFLIVLRMGLNGYLLSIIIGYLAPIVLVVIFGKLHHHLFPFRVDICVLKDMLIYSIPMIPAILAWTVNTSIDKYMIIEYVGMGSNGIYSVAHKIPTLLTTTVNIFLQAWQLSAISNSGEKDEGEYYTRVYVVLHVVSLIGCLLIIPLSKPLSFVLFDDAYYLAWQCIPMLTLSAFFSTLGGFLAAAFRAHMRTKELFLSVFVGALVNIGLNFVFIKEVGIIGAAIATAISFCIVWIIRVVMVQRLVRVNVRVLKTIISYVLLAIATLGITFDFKFAYILFFCIGVFIIIMHIKELVALLKWIKVLMTKAVNLKRGQ